MSAMLPRNTTVDETMVRGAQRNGAFNITGALANRKVEHKNLPAYEMDARVALRFRVDWSGRVLDGIVVVVSSGSPTFDNKVVAELKNWVFNALPSERSNEIQEGVITFNFRGV
jgi:TonB family protein